MSETILILDTATENCSAALFHQGQLYQVAAEAPREHSQRILPMVEGLLTQAQIGLKQVDVIGFGRGPGSFTGIRIGIAMVQGLALGAEKPVLPLSNLAALAQGAIDQGATQVLCAIDARMGEVYFGHYQAVDGLARLVGEEQVIAPAAIQQQLDAIETTTAAVGTGFDAYPELLANPLLQFDARYRLPTAAMLLPLARAAWQAGEAIAIEEAEPVYLRNEVTWQKLPGRE